MADTLTVERDFLTREYVASTMRLVRSMMFVTNTEATKYNEWIALAYPTFAVDSLNKTTWRYYMHLAGLKHPLDVPVTLVSVDTGETIELTHESMVIHTETKNELLKFTTLYRETLRRFPDQNLFVQACILPRLYDLQEIVELPEYSLITYNDRLVEKREYNLIFDLEEWVQNYKVTRLIPYYNLADSLFHSAQLTTFYSALFQKVIALRVKNSNTYRAHSYHILNFFASNQRLDNVYTWLTDRQIIYLYRNILYLRNHVGRNHIFKALMLRLFEERRISVLNYTFQQKHELRDDSAMKSEFVRRFLTTAFGREERTSFPISKIREIESTTTHSNPLIWESEEGNIQEQFDNTRFTKLLSKDLESSIFDYSDNVESPLALVIVNTWGYLLKTNRASFNVKLRNIKTNKDVTINSMDGFRLYWAVMLRRFHNTVPNQFENQEVFPTLNLRGVFKEPLPSAEFLMEGFYKPKYLYRPIINDILNVVPEYTNCTSVSQFEALADRLYRFNFAMWIYRSNISDMNDKGQMERAWWRLHDIHTFEINEPNESIRNFLLRIGFYDIVEYDDDELDELLFSLIDYVFNSKYAPIFDIRFVQRAMVDVFNQISSYSVQFVNIYTNESPTLLGLDAIRYASLAKKQEVIPWRIQYTTIIENNDTTHYTVEPIHFTFEVTSSSGSTVDVYVPLSVVGLTGDSSSYEGYSLNLTAGFSVDSSNQEDNAPTQERLEFLFENPF